MSPIAALSGAPPAHGALAVALDGMVRLALCEVAEGQCPCLSEALGLEAPQLWVLAGHVAPALAAALLDTPIAPLQPLDSEEEALRDLLIAECALPAPLDVLLPTMTARRAMRPDHLWQDMGLPERPALSRLIALAWPRLSAGNVNNMRWKRYFYRALCEAEGFSLCAVPHCRDCSEYAACFGEESGESAFARRVVAQENRLAPL